MKVGSNIAAAILTRFQAKFERPGKNDAPLECAAAGELLSPFIDSMATTEEREHLQAHLAECPPCRRELQSLVAMRNALAGVEQVAPPADLALETRVKLSHARYRNYREDLARVVADVLKPLIIRAAVGASATLLLFGTLLLGLVSNTTVMANTIVDDPAVPVFKPVTTTDSTKIWLASNGPKGLLEPLMIEASVGYDGRVNDYRILQGPETPEVSRSLRDLLYYAQFSPATSFGVPVNAKVILSFEGVRS